MTRMCLLFSDAVDEGTEVDMFTNADVHEIFPVTVKLLNEIAEADDVIVPCRRTRRNVRECGDKSYYYHDYLLNGDRDEALKKIVGEFGMREVY